MKFKNLKTFAQLNESVTNKSDVEDDKIEIFTGSHASNKNRNIEAFKRLNALLLSPKNPLEDMFQDETLMLDDTDGLVSIIHSSHQGEHISQAKAKRLAKFIRANIKGGAKIYIGDYVMNESDFSSISEAVADKDWDRMLDLVMSKKDGAPVAGLIKDKKKAINRFVAGLKLRGEEPNYNGRGYRGSFAEFGNRALELGATQDEIRQAFDEATVPQKYTEKMSALGGKKLANRFVGDLSRAIIKAGYNITFLPHNGNAITGEGRDAMSRNGRKWTIGYKTEIEADGEKFKLGFDAITDEGDGPTYYVVSNMNSTDTSSIFRMHGTMGRNEFLAKVLAAIPKVAVAESRRVEHEEIYFETLSATLEEVNRLVKAKGYDAINPDEFFKFGQGGISYGQTKSEQFDLFWGEKPVKPARRMNIQVYRMDSGRYELNAYIQ